MRLVLNLPSRLMRFLINIVRDSNAPNDSRILT